MTRQTYLNAEETDGKPRSDPNGQSKSIQANHSQQIPNIQKHTQHTQHRLTRVNQPEQYNYKFVATQSATYFPFLKKACPHLYLIVPSSEVIRIKTVRRIQVMK